MRQDDDGKPVLWWVELTLQGIAIALSAMILLNMAQEDAAGVPRFICIETIGQQQYDISGDRPALDARSPSQLLRHP